jgi:hypothetical protein
MNEDASELLYIERQMKAEAFFLGGDQVLYISFFDLPTPFVLPPLLPSP